MTDQEVINKYLIKNPLKRSVASKDRYLTPPCSACGKPVTAKNKRPITTPSGEMESRDYAIEGFPKQEQEDLCNTCKVSIRFYSKDLEEKYAHLVEVPDKTTDFKQDLDRPVEYFTDNLDADYLETELEYQGYSDYEMMEGTFFELKE